MQGLTPGPHHCQLPGGDCLSVPGPIGAPRARRATLDLVDTPQGACRRHDATARMGAHDAVPLPALLSPQPLAGMGVRDGTVHGLAVAIRVEDVLGAARQSAGEQGCEGWGGAGGPSRRRPTTRTRRPGHTACQSPAQACLTAPAALGGSCPALGGRRQGRRRAEQVACVARGAAPLVRRRGRHRVEGGAARQPPDDVGRLGPRTARVLRGITPVSQVPEGTPRPLGGQAIVEITGQRASGTLRHVAWWGWRGLARPGKATRATAAVAGPPCELWAWWYRPRGPP